MFYAQITFETIYLERNTENIIILTERRLMSRVFWRIGFRHNIYPLRLIHYVV